MDLLTYAQRLASKGDSNQQQHAQYLQSLIQQGSSLVKTDDKQPGNNAPLLIGGLVVFGFSLLAIGYLCGKRRSEVKES